MKKLLLLCAGAAMLTSMSFAAGLTPALTLSPTTKTVTPDGTVNTDGSEAWSTTWTTLTDAKIANTTSGMTAKFQITYNQKYLWIALEQDNNTEVDSSYLDDPWQRDCFEVMIGMDTNDFYNNGKYKEGDLQFRMDRGPLTIKSPFVDSTDQAAGKKAVDINGCLSDAGAVAMNNADFKVGQTDVGTGFTQEWQFPWKGLVATMKDSGKFLGNYFKLEMQGADCTTPGGNAGRSQQMFWHNNSDVEYSDTRTFSLVYLSEKVGVNSVSPVSNTFKVYPSVTSDVLKFSQTVNNAIIYNAAGQEVEVLRNVNQVNVSDYNAGIYFVKAGNQTARFIKR
jgi:hypothetical protein